jgi:hypothetical protein
MDSASLMNRIDTKYLLPLSDLPTILEKAREDYYILTIDSKKVFTYNTAYFDTADYKMYLAHHNGKLNRFKIRKRKYIDSGDTFLEIKFKNNKGKTLKSRILTKNENGSFTEKEQKFLEGSTPFKTDDLNIKLHNDFKRITLVNHKKTERITIDIGISFKLPAGSNYAGMPELMVVEIKKDRYSDKSSVIKYFMQNQIMPTSFSKYCVGNVMLKDDIKVNRFKDKIKEIEKLKGNGQ